VSCIVQYSAVAGGQKTSLQVVAWPYKGKPGKISVFRDSPSATAWVRAQITFRHIDNLFLVMFRAKGSATKGDTLHLAIDQVTDTDIHLDSCWSPGGGPAREVWGPVAVLRVQIIQIVCCINIRCSYDLHQTLRIPVVLLRPSFVRPSAKIAITQ
jgi:hypothetical protein